jgi:hypothetical protein
VETYARSDAVNPDNSPVSAELKRCFTWTDVLTLPPAAAAISCLLLSVNADTTVIANTKQPSIR